jgi:hypothetical protein
MDGWKMEGGMDGQIDKQMGRWMDGRWREGWMGK